MHVHALLQWRFKLASQFYFWPIVHYLILSHMHTANVMEILCKCNNAKQMTMTTKSLFELLGSIPPQPIVKVSVLCIHFFCYNMEMEGSGEQICPLTLVLICRLVVWVMC